MRSCASPSFEWRTPDSPGSWSAIAVRALSSVAGVPSPPPPPPPPTAAVCDCDLYTNGLKKTDPATQVCLKVEGFRRLCRPLQTSMGGCNSDHRRCYVEIGGAGLCEDREGKWATRKCQKKLRKGKCKKKKVKNNCKLTCNNCFGY